MFIKHLGKGNCAMTDSCSFLSFNIDSKQLILKKPLHPVFYTYHYDYLFNLNFMSHDRKYVFGGFNWEGFRLIPTKTVGLCDPHENQPEHEDIKEIRFPTNIIYRVSERSFNFAPNAPYIGIINGSIFFVYDYEKNDFILEIKPPTLKKKICFFSRDFSKVLLVYRDFYGVNIHVYSMEGELIWWKQNRGDENTILAANFLDDSGVFILHRNKIEICDTNRDHITEIPIDNHILKDKNNLLSAISLHENNLYLFMVYVPESYYRTAHRSYLLRINTQNDHVEFVEENYNFPASIYASLNLNSMEVIPERNIIMTHNIILTEKSSKLENIHQISLYNTETLEAEKLYYSFSGYEEIRNYPDEWKSICNKILSNTHPDNLVSSRITYNIPYEDIELKRRSFPIVDDFTEEIKGKIREFKHSEISYLIIGGEKDKVWELYPAISEDTEIKCGALSFSPSIKYYPRYFLNDMIACKDKVILTNDSYYIPVLDLQKGEIETMKPKWLKSEVNNLGYDPISKYAVLQGYPGYLTVMDTKTWHALGSIPQEKYGILSSSYPPAISLGGTHVYYSGLLWNTKTNQLMVAGNREAASEFGAVFLSENSGILYSEHHIFDLVIEEDDFSVKEGKIYQDIYCKIIQPKISQREATIKRIRYFHEFRMLAIILYYYAENKYRYILIDTSAQSCSSVFDTEEIDIPIGTLVSIASYRKGHRCFPEDFFKVESMIEQIKPHSCIPDICIHPNGKTVVLSSRAALQFHDLETGECVGLMFRHEPIRRLSFTEDGKFLVVLFEGYNLSLNKIAVFTLQKTDKTN